MRAGRDGQFSVGAKVGLTMLLLGMVALLAAPATFSAFSGTTTNSGNQFTAGTVAIGDNDSGSSMFVNLTGLKPGDVFTRCIKVTYTGSLNANVRVFGSGTGSLGQYLDLQVTRGTSGDAFSSCTNFAADSQTYVAGQPAGVIYNGTMAAFPTTWSTGIVDPSAANTAATWATNDARVYRFRITLQDNNAAQGQTATQSFTWEARDA